MFFFRYMGTITFAARNWHFWSFWAWPCRLIWCPIGGLVGGCGARAVSRKTPIYFVLPSSSSSSPSSHHHFHFHLQGETCHDQKLGRSSWWIAVDKHTKATVRAPSMRFISPFKTHLHHHRLLVISFWFSIWFRGILDLSTCS